MVFWNCISLYRNKILQQHVICRHVCTCMSYKYKVICNAHTYSWVSFVHELFGSTATVPVPPKGSMYALHLYALYFRAVSPHDKFYWFFFNFLSNSASPNPIYILAICHETFHSGSSLLGWIGFLLRLLGGAFGRWIFTALDSLLKRMQISLISPVIGP